MHQHVVKSDGSKETIKLDKITRRVRRMAKGLSHKHIVPVEVTRRVADSVVDGISTSEIDQVIASEAARMVTVHPDYSILAARILASRLHKTTSDSFSETIKEMYQFVNPETGRPAPMVNKELFDLANDPATASRIDAEIDHERDFNFDYFGWATFQKGYLKRFRDRVYERPQYLWMRVALGIHGSDLESAFRVYHNMSQGNYTHATPTLFNAGTDFSQMSSCYLVALAEDSISGIYKTLADVAQISKYAGGIGVHIHNLRANDAYIAGTGGHSNGIVPMLRVYNETARYVDQGGNKRKGSFAIYLEPWHADINEFLELKKNHGKEEQRARDLFYALWIPDLFMQRVKEDGDWSLMCPHKCPGLSDACGSDFEALYTQYEADGMAKETVKARDLWLQILRSQMETGTPYICYKDAANQKSNQKNLGTIKSSNLCAEIMEYSDKDETAVCNLASIALPKFVNGGKFDFEALRDTASELVGNLDLLIDKNHYPVPETYTSNSRHRPIGIGVQGLADVFALMKMAFDSPEARMLNKRIHENIYYGALRRSIALAGEKGSYSTFEGSPASQGILQFDMWGADPVDGDLDWSAMREAVKKGLRNSLLVALMPTASTSQILGNNECFEPITSNIYVRRVLSGEFVVVNKHLVNDLDAIGLWGDEVKNDIIRHNGSVQELAYIPEDIRARYRTVWEVSQKSIIDMSADRGAYVCQSQSMNLFLPSPSVGQMNSMHFYAWEKGLKTGMYYLRSKPAGAAKKITIASSSGNKDEEALVCSIENPEACDMCSS